MRNFVQIIIASAVVAGTLMADSPYPMPNRYPTPPTKQRATRLVVNESPYPMPDRYPTPPTKKGTLRMSTARAGLDAKAL